VCLVGLLLHVTFGSLIVVGVNEKSDVDGFSVWANLVNSAIDTGMARGDPNWMARTLAMARSSYQMDHGSD
jgi:hypothetical protein